MRVQIKAEQPLGPLSVLKELPDAHLAVLEGLNGIGKTLAVRILQICTGTIPYRRDSAAWQSLCRGLGEVEVTITGLNGANEIHWDADSRDWLEVVEGQTVVPFKSITIDGRPVKDFREVTEILEVHRLAGDEGIIETFAQQADAEASSVARWARRFADQEDSPLAQLEHQLGYAVENLTDWSIERYQQVKLTIQRAQEAHDKASALMERSIEKRDELIEAANLQRQLGRIVRRLPDLEQQLVATDAEIQKIQSQRDAIQDQLMDLAGQLAGAEALVRELRNARRTRDRNRERLSEELDKIGRVTSDLGIEPTQEAVTTTLTELRSVLETLTAEQLEMDAAPTMRHLLVTLSDQLAEAEQSGLADQLAVDDSETDTQLTVAQTRGGMLNRRTQLEGQPPPPEARELMDRIADVRHRIDLCNRALQALEEAGRFERLAASNEHRVDDALGAMDSQAASRVQDLLNRRRSLDEQILKLAAIRASLRQQLGSLGGEQNAESIRRRISQIVEHHDIDPEEIDTALQGAEQTVSRADEGVSRTSADLVTAKRELARANAEIRRAVSALATDSQLEWLRLGLGYRSDTQVTGSPESMLTTLQAVRVSVRTSMQRLAGLRSQLGAVERALRALADHLRGNESNTREYLEQLQHWLGKRFSTWFNVPRVRAELLPDAEGDISVDLRRREVAWTENGAEVVRPLEAFSSGEQAFAYTRARLAILDDEERRARNRLIALDEFGAFIAFDRLSGLTAYLTERAGQHPDDQVLVILPLAQDYSERAGSAVGSEAARLQGLADEIGVRGYAVQELVP